MRTQLLDLREDKNNEGIFLTLRAPPRQRISVMLLMLELLIYSIIWSPIF